jgi:hypothetical protein
VDATNKLAEQSLYSLMTTVFIVILFAVGAYVFNRDALELIVEPIERLTKLTTKLSKTVRGVCACVRVRVCACVRCACVCVCEICARACVFG